MPDYFLNPKAGDMYGNSYVTRVEASQYFDKHYTGVSNWSGLNATQQEQVLVQAAHDLELLNYKGGKYYDVQFLAFPRGYNAITTGVASINTATKMTLRGLNLKSSTHNAIPENYFKYGTVRIDAGLNRGQSRYIGSSTASIEGGYGEIVVSSPFTHNVVASDHYVIFNPIPKEVKWAQCEQAIYIAENRYYGYGDYNYSGIGYVRTGDLGMSFKNPDGSIVGKKICLKSRKLLGRHLRKTLRYGRA
jgi:hypothetical protein